MSRSCAPTPGFTPPGASIEGKLGLIRIVNFYDLLGAFGPAFYHDATSYIKSQLESIGISVSGMLLNRPYVFIDFGPCWSPDLWGDDELCEHINCLLAFRPFTCGREEAFLHVETTVADQKDLPALTNVSYVSSAQSHILASGSEQENNKRTRSYKADMEFAISLFSQLSARTLVLAFQPIVSARDLRTPIYWEALLRRKVDSRTLEPSTCAAHIAAVERLSLVSRLDRSVIWTVLDLLEEQRELRLACNISAQSLRFDCWWRVLFNTLRERRSAASRLIIEVTETSAITQDEEALTLLRTLKILGCKIAIDDMGSGYSTLDFVVRSRPDFVKIDKAYLSNSASNGLRASTGLLRNLVQLCAGICQCVITEGIESDRDRTDAVVAGSHGLQGYLFGMPSVLPDWLAEPIVVQDAFEPGHPSHSPLAPPLNSAANRPVAKAFPWAHRCGSRARARKKK